MIRFFKAAKRTSAKPRTAAKKKPVSQDVAAAIGRQGEDQVASLLTGLPGCKLYRNLYIPCGSRTVEIDAVLISPKGIFVVETKNYTGSGVIRGSLTRYEWSITCKDGPPRKFYSPLRQAIKHTQVLAKYLGVPQVTCHTLVVFTARANLKHVHVPASPEYTICQTPELRSIITKRLKTRQDRFTPEKLRDIQKRLSSIPRATKSVQKAHVRQAKQAEKARKALQAKRRAQRKKRS